MRIGSCENGSFNELLQKGTDILMENMKEFAKKLAEDKAFAEEIAKAASKEELLAKAKEAGFELTAADLTELAEAGKGELSDDELDGVAGGSAMSNLFKPCPKCGRMCLIMAGCPDYKTGTYAFL